MADIRPFSALRPAQGLESEIAALPYDVYTRAEARLAAEQRPRSFLRIDRAETQLPEDADMYGEACYRKARELFETAMELGEFRQDRKPCFYLYEQTFQGRSQTGIVACADVDEYEDGTIRRHENTRIDKELDRIRHVDALSAQTGPIFLCYRDTEELTSLVEYVKKTPSYCDFISEGQVRNRCWQIEEPYVIASIHAAFKKVPRLYIADGHHRCASAAHAAQLRRRQHPGWTGVEEFNRFLCVLFPAGDLMIMAYNRVITDLNGLSESAFLNALEQLGSVEALPFHLSPQKPKRKGEIILYLRGGNYRFVFNEELRPEDPVGSLDVSMLQDLVLGPILGITDPSASSGIRFVGGIRGAEELVQSVEQGAAAAMAMYPTSMDELMAAADADLLMPPKSTWFEPKLLSGLFIHLFER